MTPLPSGGFVAGLPEEELVNRDLPVPYEATWRVGGDGSAFQAVQNLPHVELTAGDAEADVERGPDQNGTQQTIATLRRLEAYGTVLIDSLTSVSGLPELSEVEGLFFGQEGGSLIWQFGEHWQDAGGDIVARARTLPMAPGGVGGEAVFQNLYLALEWRSAATVTVTPILDGEELTAAKRTLSLEGTIDPRREDFELPLNLAHDVGGTEELRYGPRGTWFQVEIEATVHSPTETGLVVEGIEVEREVVRESHPAISYAIEDLEEVTAASPVPWYIGAGSSLYRGDTGRDDAGADINARAQTVYHAPGGPGGEAVFHNLYLAITRSNPADATLTVTPLVDGEEKEAEILTLPGVASPVTEVYELPLTEPYEVDGEELLRTALRGTWYATRFETTAPDGRLILEGVEIERELVREGEEAAGA